MNIPAKIGPYELLTEIGRGPTSRVWLAYDESTGTQVAVKVYPQGLWSGGAHKHTLPNILQAVALLEHPALLAVEDMGEVDGQVFLVLPYLAGGSLADRLRQGTISQEDAYWVVTQVAAGLGMAHSRGLYHFNLKPADILFDAEGVPVLAGIGLAQAQAGEPHQLYQPRPASLWYASPERALGWEGLGPESDIYALAALAWHMLTGSPPFATDDPLMAATYHILDENLSAPPAADLPPAAFEVLRRAMRKDPWERYPTLRSFAADLGASLGFEVSLTDEITTEIAMATHVPVRAGPPSPPLPPPPPPAPRRWGGLAWVSALLLLALVLGGGFLAWQNPPWLASAWAQVAAALPPGLVKAIQTPTSPPPSFTPAQAEAPATAMPPTSPPTQTAASILPTDTPAQPTDTPQPTLTPAAASPTATTAPLILGGADKIAFVNLNDIWIASLDGKDLTQLTFDGIAKSSLEWTPDGKYLLYMVDFCYFRIAYGSTISERLGCFEDVEYSANMADLVVGGRIYGDNTGWVWWNHFGPATDSLLKTSSMGQAYAQTGCSFRGGKQTRFAQTGDLMAAVFESAEGGKLVEIIRVFHYKDCQVSMNIADSFPAKRFSMRGYSGVGETPVILDYAWDGDVIFALHGNIRNGFGDLQIYNSSTWLSEVVNPIDGTCCYKDLSFSPDGSYLVFVYRNIDLTLQSKIYMVQFGTIGSGRTYTPLDIPYYFFASASDAVSPALRPAK